MTAKRLVRGNRLEEKGRSVREKKKKKKKREYLCLQLQPVMLSTFTGSGGAGMCSSKELQKNSST